MIEDIDVLKKCAKKTLVDTKSNSSLKVNSVADGRCINAQINVHSKDISINIPTNWSPEKYEKIKRFARIIEKDIETCEIGDVVYHEVGHDKLKNDQNGLGCPQDVEGKEICIDGTIRGMLENQKYSQDGALYLENTISDIIDNTNGSRHTDFDGLTMFFAEQAELNGGKFSPLYETFVKLNMEMWGNRVQKIFMKTYYTNKKEIDDIVKLCIQDMELKKDKDTNVSILFNKADWENTYYTFSKHLSKLMEFSVPEILFGSGSGGKGYKVPVSFDGSGKIDPEKVDDPLLKRVLDKDNLKKSMVKRNKEGKGIPAFVENWRALDLLYQGLASEIYIKAETLQKGESMPIASIQSRMFDPEKDDLEKIIFGKILIDDNGIPALAVPRAYLEQAVKYKLNNKSYPDLNIALIDLSISMLEGADNSGVGRKNIIPWGDNSKYHFALLTYRGIEKALHRLGIGVKTKYNVITFKDVTSATGVRDFYDDNRLRRLYNPVFGDNTLIDIDILKKECRQPGSILITISDGEIHNWSSIHDPFREIVSDKCYAHFQIGTKDTAATAEIRSWGVPVNLVNAKEMPKRAIDVVKTIYRSFAAGDYRAR